MKKSMLLLFAACTLLSPIISCASASLDSLIASCSPCHGETGTSLNPIWPNLAHQHAPYLLKQLQDFKKASEREALLMKNITESLTEADMKTLADYFSKQPLPTTTKTSSKNEKGRILYQQGDKEKQITACSACHGPDGLGNQWAGFPALKHQNALYIIEQLKAFKTTQRKNDAYETMRRVASKMDSNDMKAVADYLEMLP